MNIPTLRVFTPVIWGDINFVADLSQRAIGYRRSIRAMGGFWKGSFSVVGSFRDLAQMFYYWLGYHFTEHSGGYHSWEGLIYEMDLAYGGTVRRRSLDMIRNYWTASFLDEEGERQDTAAASNSGSISHYGRYEGLLTEDGLTLATAEAARDTHVKMYSWPEAKVVGAPVQPEGEAVLDVTVAGYAFTANWRFQQVGDGSQDSVSDWISEITDTDCEYIFPVDITANTLQVYKTCPQPRRCWDLLRELASLGDVDGNPYRLYVERGRGVYYKLINTRPKYFMRGGVIYSGPGGRVEIDPWKVQPAVMRDMDWPVIGTLGGGFLPDGRDFYADEIDVGVDTGLRVTSEWFDDAEILFAQQQYLRANEPPEED